MLKQETTHKFQFIYGSAYESREKHTSIIDLYTKSSIMVSVDDDDDMNGKCVK